MHRVRAVLKALLFGLLWALSVAAFCVPLTGAGTAVGAQPGWARTLPDTGVWLVAAVALALMYRYAAGRTHVMRRVGLWILAALLAGVATLGESFAQTGTAELALAAPLLTLLYFAGRVPVYYLGMALLWQALAQNSIVQPGEGNRAQGESRRSGSAALSAREERGESYFAAIPGQHRRADWGSMPRSRDSAAAAAMPLGGTLRTGEGPRRPDGSAGWDADEAADAHGNLYPPRISVNASANIRPFSSRGPLPAEVYSAPEGELYDPAMFDRPLDAEPYSPSGVPPLDGIDYDGLQPAQGYTPQQDRQGGGAHTRRAAAQRARAQSGGQRGHTGAKRRDGHTKGSAPTSRAGARRYGANGGMPERRSTAPVPTWLFTLLLLLCWLPYLLAVWPGTVSNDSITQLAEIFGAKPLSAGNPLAQTGLIWVFVQLGQGLLNSADAAVALYIGVQGLLMAWLLGYAAARVQRSGAPGWLTGLTVAFFALCPVFPTFAFCVGKDTNFAMAVLWFTLMIWRLTDSRWPPLRTALGLCLSAVLCVLLRNAGGYLAIETLLLMLLYFILKHEKRWRVTLAALLFAGAAMLAMPYAVQPRLGAEPMPVAEMRSVQVQQLARTVASETLTEAERAAIDAVLPVDALKAAYNGELSDPVKALWRDGVTPEQRIAMEAVWLRLGAKYPATYLSATFHNSYGYLLPGYVSTIKPTLLLGAQGRTALIDGLFDFTVNPVAEQLKSGLQSLFAYVPFRLLTAPGLYGCLALFALAGLWGVRKRGKLLCMLPVLFTLAGCLFSAVNGYFRYAMPLYFAAPVLLALLSQALRSDERVQEEAERLPLGRR